MVELVTVFVVHLPLKNASSHVIKPDYLNV